MKPRFAKGLAAALGIVALAALCVPGAQAQERGQYLPGFRGLNSGMQAPPGFTYANYFFWYPTNTLKDRDGNRIPISPGMNVLADMNVFAYTTKKKFLGANYGFVVAVPVTNIALDLERVGSGFQTFGLADIYVEPINLGWHGRDWHVYTAYGFMAPTGRFDQSDPTNTTTTDFWGHQLTFAATKNFTKSQLWQVSASSVWELHHRKRHEDIKVGENVTFEYGVGKTWVRNRGQNLVQLGGVGYAEFQLANDTGSAVPVFNRNKDRVFAMGPEFGMIWPAKRVNFLVRVLPEFGARSRTQGVTLTFAIAKTFGKAPPPPGPPPPPPPPKQ